MCRDYEQNGTGWTTAGKVKLSSKRRPMVGEEITFVACGNPRCQLEEARVHLKDALYLSESR